MADINLKLLQSFLLVARLGSFRAAAAAARRTTSAISMQIKELEDQIGLRLFVRHGRQVTLTPDGQRLFERTNTAMRDIDEGFRTLAERVALRQATVTIACASTLAAKPIGDVLTRFRKRFADSRVRLIEAPPAAALELLDRQDAEFYVGPEITVPTSYRFEHLTDDPLLACIPPEFDSDQTAISFADLGDTPVIVLDPSTSIRRLVDGITTRQNKKLNIAYELQNAYTALSFAAAGLGIALLPRIAINMARFDGFRVVPFTEADAVRSVGIIANKGLVQRNYSEKLLSLIREAFEKQKD
ncbi:MAG: LysR family transcriptional regulator [Pseudomonadota bacterium]